LIARAKAAEGDRDKALAANNGYALAALQLVLASASIILGIALEGSGGSRHIRGARGFRTPYCRCKI
jgi:hypothetical protein